MRPTRLGRIKGPGDMHAGRALFADAKRRTVAIRLVLWLAPARGSIGRLLPWRAGRTGQPPTGPVPVIADTSGACLVRGVRLAPTRGRPHPPGSCPQRRAPRPAHGPVRVAEPRAVPARSGAAQHAAAGGTQTEHAADLLSESERWTRGEPRRPAHSRRARPAPSPPQPAPWGRRRTARCARTLPARRWAHVPNPGDDAWLLRMAPLRWRTPEPAPPRMVSRGGRRAVRLAPAHRPAAGAARCAHGARPVGRCTPRRGTPRPPRARRRAFPSGGAPVLGGAAWVRRLPGKRGTAGVGGRVVA